MPCYQKFGYFLINQKKHIFILSPIESDDLLNSDGARKSPKMLTLQKM